MRPGSAVAGGQLSADDSYLKMKESRSVQHG